MNKRLLASLVASTCLIAQRPVRPSSGTPSLRPIIDMRDQDYVTYSILGTAHYSVRKMDIGFRELSALTGASDADRRYVEGQIEDQMRDMAASYIVSTCPELASVPIVSCFYNGILSEWAAGFDPYTMAAMMIYYTYQEIVVSEHTRQHVYAFYAPADAFYSISTWVPGDWDKPDSIIKVYGHTAQGSTQYYNYDQTNVSDRVVSSRVWLPKGTYSVVVSVGSGSLNFHNAGHLQSVILDNDGYVDWSVSDSVAAAKRVQLKSVLPAPGSTYSDHLDFVSPGLQNPKVINGSISYTDLHAAEPAFTFHSDQTNQVQIPGQPNWPNDFWDYNLGTWRYTRLMAHSASPVALINGRVNYKVTRDPDQVFSTFNEPYYPNASPYSLNEVILENILQAEQQ